MWIVGSALVSGDCDDGYGNLDFKHMNTCPLLKSGKIAQLGLKCRPYCQEQFPGAQSGATIPVEALQGTPKRYLPPALDVALAVASLVLSRPPSSSASFSRCVCAHAATGDARPCQDGPQNTVQSTFFFFLKKKKPCGRSLRPWRRSLVRVSSWPHALQNQLR